MANANSNTQAHTNEPVEKYVTVVVQKGINKSYDPSGKIKRSQPLYNAEARTVQIDSIENFSNMLEDISDDTDKAIIMGYHPETTHGKPYHLIGSKTQEVWQKKRTKHKYEQIFRRTQESFKHCGFLCMDFDQPNWDGKAPEGWPADFDEWLSLMEKAFPDIKDWSYVVTVSNSSRVILDGDLLIPHKQGGFHFYFEPEHVNYHHPIKDNYLPQARAAGLLWNAPAINDDGDVVQTTGMLFDGTITESNRIIYEGAPTVKGGVEVLRQTFIKHAGIVAPVPIAVNAPKKMTDNAVTNMPEGAITKWMIDYGVKMKSHDSEWTQITCPNNPDHYAAFSDKGKGKGSFYDSIQFKCQHANNGCPEFKTGKFLAWVSNQGGPQVMPTLTDIYNEYNAQYRPILLGGKVRVVKVNHDAPPEDEKENNLGSRKGPKVAYHTYGSVSDTDLQKLLAPHRAVNPNSDKPNKPIGGLIKRWMHWPLRKTYSGAYFKPELSYETGCFDLPDTPKLNMWRGYQFEPKQGKWALFHEHIREVICAGDDEKLEYVLDWIAISVQQPGLTGIPLLLLHSDEQGTGKNRFVELFLGRLFGPHFSMVSDFASITGNFNGLLELNCMMFINEALWKGEKSSLGHYKTMFTDEVRIVRKLYTEPFTVPSYTKGIIASNGANSAPIQGHDRRHVVCDVSPHRKGDLSYFDDLTDEMENDGGKEAMLFDMLRRKVDIAKVRKLPRWHSDIKEELMEENADSWVRWLKHCIDNENPLPMNVKIEYGFSPVHWGDPARKEDLYEDYKAFCHESGYQKRGVLANNSFFKRCKKLLGGRVSESRPGIDGGVGRKAVWTYNPIDECRTAFEARSGLSMTKP